MSFVFMHVIVCAQVREVSQAHWRTRGLEPVLIPSRLSLCKQHVNSFELSFSPILVKESLTKRE